MLEIGLFLAALVFSIIGWLLRQKDAQQERQLHSLREDCLKRDAVLKDQIALLFTKHDQDANALQELRLEIARDHYQKEELDQRFARLEQAFQKGFDDLGKKFDRLTDALMQHLREDNGKERRL